MNKPTIIEKDLKGNAMGFFNADDNTIIIEESMPYASKQAVIAHEMQHWFEFASGRSALRWDKARKIGSRRKWVRAVLDEEYKCYRKQYKELSRYEGQECLDGHAKAYLDYLTCSKREFRERLEKGVKINGKTQYQFYSDSYREMEHLLKT